MAFLTFCNFPAPGLHPCIAHVKPPVCPNWDWGLEFQLADTLWVAQAQKNCHLVIQTTFESLGHSEQILNTPRQFERDFTLKFCENR